MTIKVKLARNNKSVRRRCKSVLNYVARELQQQLLLFYTVCTASFVAAGNNMFQQQSLFIRLMCLAPTAAAAAAVKATTQLIFCCCCCCFLYSTHVPIYLLPGRCDQLVVQQSARASCVRLEQRRQQPILSLRSIQSEHQIPSFQVDKFCSSANYLQFPSHHQGKEQSRLSWLDFKLLT